MPGIGPSKRQWSTAMMTLRSSRLKSRSNRRFFMGGLPGKLNRRAALAGLHDAVGGDAAERVSWLFSTWRMLAGTIGVTGPVRGEAGDEPLPGDVAVGETVQKLTSFEFFRSRGPMVAAFGGSSRCPPSSSSRRRGCLAERDRVELHDARAFLEVGVDVVAKLLPEVGLEKGDVPGPADAAVSDVGAAEVFQHPAVVRDVLSCPGNGSASRASAASGRCVEEVVPHPVLETALPVARGGVAVLVRVLVHVEGVDVVAGMRRRLIISATNAYWGFGAGRMTTWRRPSSRARLIPSTMSRTYAKANAAWSSITRILKFFAGACRCPSS